MLPFNIYKTAQIPTSLGYMQVRIATIPAEYGSSINVIAETGDIFEGSTFGTSTYSAKSQTYAPLASDFLIHGKGRDYLVKVSGSGNSRAYTLYSGPTTSFPSIARIGECNSGSFTIAEFRYRTDTDAWGLAYRFYYVSNATSNNPLFEMTQTQTDGTNLGYGILTYSRNDSFTVSNTVAKNSVVDVTIRDILANARPSGGSDPYSQVGTTDKDGGDGSFDFATSDPISVPADPEYSAVNTGFISLWSPTEQQLLDLSNFLWNADILSTNFWLKMVANPLELVYGLNIFPFDLRDVDIDAVGGTDNVVVGLINTRLEMDWLSRQWITIECGDINIDETWGAYIDYDPFTKIEIYLPYCGTHPLRIDDFMSGVMSVTYKVDLLTGACVAMISSTKTDPGGAVLNSVMYQFMGNCAAQVPVTASQFADAVRSAISLAASIGTMALMAGAGGAAAATAGATSMPAAEGTSTVKNVAMIKSGASLAENVLGLKPSVERSGAIGAAAGMLCVQTPYIILTRPRQAHPDSQNNYTGYPSFITENLGDLNGFTQIQAIHLEGMTCTSEELAEIDQLLHSGVIF